MAEKGLLIDTVACIGCEECYIACKEYHEHPLDQEDEDLSATAYTVLQEREGYYVRKLCMHCVDPSCVSVCPVGALEKTESGAVTYDGDKCMGCRYCILACPFDVPRYEWSKAVPTVQKCNMCHELIVEGEWTTCADVCPAEATVFGDREELIEEARRRIRQDPDYYVDYVYGEEEVGGTSTLILTGIPRDELKLKDVPTGQAPPQLTWNVLSKIPSLVAVLGTGLAGVWWITKRRDDVREAEGREEVSDD